MCVILGMGVILPPISVWRRGTRARAAQVHIGHLKRGHDRYLRQLLIHGARSALRHLGDKQDAQSLLVAGSAGATWF